MSEGGSEMERELVFTVTRDVNATLDRDVFVSLATADGSATGTPNTITDSALINDYSAFPTQLYLYSLCS